MVQSRLDRWPVFSLLDPSFVLKVKIACVFGGAGNEAIVVTKDDEVYSIGSNCSNCLGVGEGVGGLQPRKIDSLTGKKLSSFAFGSGPHVLAINSEGDLYSWGHNGYGQLGLGNQLGLVPMRVVFGVSGLRIVQVACGSHHSLALSCDGEVFAWGYSNCGQVGLGITTNQPSPRRVQTNIGGKFCVKIACGQTSSLALTRAGELYAWGNNGNGQLGVGNSSNQPTPLRVSALQGLVVTQIVCGYAHALALTEAGHLYSWGSNSYGQLGTGNKINAVSPARVGEDIGKFVDIAACHYSHVSAATKQNGLLYMWGQCRGQPILVPMETKFDSLDDVFACFASPASMWRPLIIYSLYANSLVADMKGAFNDQESSDLTVVVAEKPIYVHKAILKIRCKHFQSMFQEGHWVEGGKNTIQVSEFSYPVYKAFLYYLYSDEIDLSSEESLGLLDLSICYFEDHLRYKCEQLIKQAVMVDNVAMVYEAALRYNSEDLLGYCFRFAMEHMTNVIQTEAFANLEEATMKLFIRKAAEKGAFKT